MHEHDEAVAEHDQRPVAGQTGKVVKSVLLTILWAIIMVSLGISIGINISRHQYAKVISTYEEAVKACKEHLDGEQDRARSQKEFQRYIERKSGGNEITWI